MEVLNWFQTNWTDITTAIAYIIAIASIVVKLTPSIADDNALKGVIKFVGRYIALNR
jgi:hypothetical protein